MGKFFGCIGFFLVAVILVYLLNLPHIDNYATLYLIYDSFEAPHVIAAFELLHHPFEYIWVIPSWFIASFLGGIITRSRKGALLVSIITGFVLSLTWIFLMSRYIPNYWNFFTSTRSTLEFLGQTLGIGLLLGVLASGPSICGAYLTAPRKSKIEDTPLKKIETVCPNCGTKFQSKPKYCYNCNTILEDSIKSA